MRITISGSPGSGTSSLGTFLAEKYHLKYVSAGDVFRSIAKEKGMSLLEFGKLCEENPDVDHMIDERQKQIGEMEDDIVIEGRLAGHMVDNADLKIRIVASAECRAHRIAEREGVTYVEAKSVTVVREQSEIDRYLKYYSIDITDLSVYDLVISSEKWGKEELAAVVDFALSKRNL